MKIISGNDCYVQRSDLEYLIDNTSKVSSDLYREYKMSVLSDEDFIKIENPIVKKLIINSEIPSFDELNSLSINKLEELVFKIKLAIFDSFDDELTDDEIKEIDEMVKERKNREYILKQLKEIIKYKQRRSNLKYPDVPNNKYESITDGVYNASVSINFDKVLIYSADGSRITNPEDIEFCKVAYNLLMHDNILDSNVNLEMVENNKYIVLNNIYTKIRKRKNI